jgi:Secretion system C-terminal sorting domain
LTLLSLILFIHVMKNFIFSIIFFVGYSNAFAQKQDYTWPIGYQSEWIGTTGETIDFNFNPPKVDSAINKVQTFRVSSAMCDSVGNLILYTNGRNICNKAGLLLLNSENLNDCDIDWGCYFTQAALILPYPKHVNQFIQFANNYTQIRYNGINQYVSLPLNYSIIDMNTPQGRGTVIQKNISILNDTMMLGELTACRHANGRDWWVLINKHQSTVWYRLLVSPNGVQVMGSQDIGFQKFERGFGQSVFSPNGNWFAIGQVAWSPTYNNFFELFQFNRCTGLLTQNTILRVLDTAGVLGVAISANSRYLYTCTLGALHQFDLQASNIGASKIKIADYDEYKTNRNFPSYITIPQLAPNGKIYIATYPTTNVLHVIEAPDSAGLACNFRQHAIPLPTYNSAVPNYPNFRLGRLIGSSCDTLYSPTNELNKPLDKLKVFPNPVSNILKIDLSLSDYNHLGKVLITLTDILARQVFKKIVSDFSSIVEIDVSRLTEGVYICNLEIEGQIVGVQRVVVQR